MKRPEILAELSSLENQIKKIRVKRHNAPDDLQKYPLMVERYQKLKTALERIDAMEVAV